MNRVFKLFYLFPILLLSWQPNNSVAANVFNVDFNGELISTACKIATKDQQVTLYNLRWQNLNTNKKSALFPFSIGVEKCINIDLQKDIKLTWKSNELVNVDGTYFLKTTGDSGVLLGLVDNDENPIVWNQPITIGTVNVENGLQTFNFNVFARKPANGDVKIGDFSGIVTFNMEYE